MKVYEHIRVFLQYRFLSEFKSTNYFKQYRLYTHCPENLRTVRQTVGRHRLLSTHQVYCTNLEYFVFRLSSDDVCHLFIGQAKIRIIIIRESHARIIFIRYCRPIN